MAARGAKPKSIADKRVRGNPVESTGRSATRHRGEGRIDDPRV